MNEGNSQLVETEHIENATARDAVTVLGDSTDLYKRKNADYGDSWKLAGKTMALWLQHQGVDELKIPVNEYTMNSLGLFTRRLDKMIRTFNGWFVADELLVDESIAETHTDDVPYAAMHTEIAEQYAAMDYGDFADGA
ncbi:hypothetical protein HCTV-15_gp57 [Haloarcula virus HCTV-15]|nr:hypothetical protein HCTV-6_gp57 [Haloarcula virus HCTV-6]UBF22531.1 hypothetical protein HCTV-15_gp57 [Haloarcula virus HCTV-15]